MRRMRVQELHEHVELTQVPRPTAPPPLSEECECPEFCLLDHSN